MGAAGSAQAAAVAIAVATAAAEAYAIGGLSGMFLSQVFLPALGRALIGSLISQVVGGLVNKGGKQQSQPNYQAEARDRQLLIRSSVEPRRVVYGTVRVSGPLVYGESTVQTTTGKRDYLHLVVPLASHECDTIQEIYLNEEPLGALDGDGFVLNGRYAGYVRVKKHLGAADQAADATLIAESGGLWTSNHRLRGICYMYVRLQWYGEVFDGLPNISALIRGKKVYDPRNATTAWSDNWALCVRDYMASDYGLGCSSAELDDTVISAAANVSDELVELQAGSPSVTQKRYTCNGTINLADQPKQILQYLGSAAAGASVFSQGKWRVFAGAYVTPAVQMDEDWLRGGVSLQTRRPRRELYNAVRGVFSDPNKGWQPTDFPAVVNATYETQDGGERIARDIELPLTDDVTRAQRIAKIHLEKSRQGIVVSLECNLRAFQLAVWDTVQLSIDRLGWVNKVFQVIEWSFVPAGFVKLTLAEESAACYDWAFGDATTVDPAPDTVLPNPFNVEAPGAPTVTDSLYETTGARRVQARMLVSWVEVTTSFVVGYEVQYKLAAASVWTVLPRTSATQAEVLDIAPGTYNVRVKAVSALGVSSAWSPTTTQELLGLAAAPSALTGVTIAKIGGTARISWIASSDLDVLRGGRIAIRHTAVASAASAKWEESFSIGTVDGVPGSRVDADVPLKSGCYLLRPYDSSGQPAATATVVESDGATALAWANITTLTEDTAFSGSHSNTVAADGVLKLAGAVLVDDIADWDAVTDLDSAGGIVASGVYTFSAGADLGVPQRVRVRSEIEGYTENVNDLFDDRSGNIDDWPDFDGTGASGSAGDCWLEVRDTDDNPAGSPTWRGWNRADVTEFNGRGFQVRAQLRSTDPAFNIIVSRLRAHIEVQA